MGRHIPYTGPTSRTEACSSGTTVSSCSQLIKSTAVSLSGLDFETQVAYWTAVEKVQKSLLSRACRARREAYIVGRLHVCRSQPPCMVSIERRRSPSTRRRRPVVRLCFIGRLTFACVSPISSLNFGVWNRFNRLIVKLLTVEERRKYRSKFRRRMDRWRSNLGRQRHMSRPQVEQTGRLARSDNDRAGQLQNTANYN